MRTHNRPKRSQKKSDRETDAFLETWAPSPAQLPRELAGATKEYRIVKKVLCQSSTLSTSAGGYVVEQAVTGSNAVSVAGTWSAISANFLEYRVIGLEVKFFPIVNAQTSFTTPPPCMLALAAYSSGYAPTTYQQVAEGPTAKIVNALRPFSFNATAKGNSNAMLWTATNATIAAANVFGVIIASDSTVPAGPVTQAVIRWTVRYLVEFRSLI
jgi:hypothetical protein